MARLLNSFLKLYSSLIVPTNLNTGCFFFFFLGSVEITEANLVRDVLYVFQGIDGKNIKMCNSENCYKVEGKVLIL